VIVMSSRPGTIRSVAEVKLPRPRDVFHVRFSPEFGEYFEALWSALKDDMKNGTELH
jgi:NitT/TauT family transport system ATP-binding protein